MVLEHQLGKHLLQPRAKPRMGGPVAALPKDLPPKPRRMGAVIRDALPHAYLVPAAESDDQGDALSRLVNGAFDPTRRILVDVKRGSAELASVCDVPAEQSVGTTEIVKDDVGKLTVRVQ